MDKKPRILIVDDERLNINVLADLLKTDYKIMAAISGEQALKAVRATPQPDLVLLDIMMPEMDGFEVCRRLKEDSGTRDIPVIFVTAMGQEEDETKGLELGAVDYITKPVVPAVVEGRVRAHVSLRRNMLELRNAHALIESQRQRMQDELSIGRDIQLSMLPRELPASRQRESFSVHGRMRAAWEVGGDFYDYFFVDEDHLLLCVGDVSGKGVPAALFMAITKALIRSRASDDLSPASILTHVNDEIAFENESCMFITVFLAILDVRTGRLRYTNAGHNPPHLRRQDGSVERLDAKHGPVIGAIEELAYQQDETNLGKDDLILMYSDGVTEAMNPALELYEEHRLMKVLKDTASSEPTATVEAVLESVDQFADGAEQADDITLLGLLYYTEFKETKTSVLELTIRNDLAEVGRANDEFEAFANRVELSPKFVRQVMLGLDELLNNSISYGFDDDGDHEICVRIEASTTRLTVTLTDGGIPFNPFNMESPDTSLGVDKREIGGLGIHLVRSTMDEVSYKRGVNRNIVTLIKYLDED